MENSEHSSSRSKDQQEKPFESIEINSGLLPLLDLLGTILDSSEFGDLLTKVLEATKTLMRVEAGSIMLLDESREYLHIFLPTGPVKDEIKGIKIAADRGYAGRVVRNREPIIANDVQQDDKIFGGDLSENFTTRNLMCVPIFDNEKKLMGVLQVLNRYNNEDFKEEEIPVLQTLASHAAGALERIQVKQELNDVLEEHSLLLKEIHHRVKNDFALIAGIIEMERMDLDEEARNMLRNIQSRLETMSVVYDLLTHTGSSQIEVESYFKKLTRILSRTLSSKKQNIQIQVHASDFILSSRPALYSGLLINELLLNTFKHAFTDAETGRIDLHITKEGSLVTIIYKDNGKGLPENFVLEEQTSHGFEIMQALVQQLGGKIEVVRPSEGVSFRIKFEITQDADKKRAALF